MRKRIIRTTLWSVAVIILLANLMAFFHAYRFTHFDSNVRKRTDPSRISFGQKLLILFTGVKMPRPVTKKMPVRPFETIYPKSDIRFACWSIKTSERVSRGTVLLCHGYGAEKSDMLDRAEVMLKLGYNVLIPDFSGSGTAEGNQCTIGFKEAAQVQSCISYLQQKGEQHIVLFGTSMGAAAIMKAMQDYRPKVSALILECPFGSMRQTVKNRFAMMGVPSFPLSDLLVFWGGVQNGFNAFKHNPEDYAKSIDIPVLLMCGAKDDRVTRSEIEQIYKNLAGEKRVIFYPLAGHESYLNKYSAQWTNDISSFLY